MEKNPLSSLPTIPLPLILWSPPSRTTTTKALLPISTTPSHPSPSLVTVQQQLSTCSSIDYYKRTTIRPSTPSLMTCSAFNIGTADESSIVFGRTAIRQVLCCCCLPGASVTLLQTRTLSYNAATTTNTRLNSSTSSLTNHDGFVHALCQFVRVPLGQGERPSERLPHFSAWSSSSYG